MKLPRKMSENLPFLLSQVDKSIQTKVDQELAEFELTRSQWLLLAFLFFVDGSNQTDLAELLDIGKGALGKLVKKLETKGWIVREVSPFDARSINLFIAPEAKLAVKYLVDTLFEFTTVIQRNFSKEELDTLRSLLLKVQTQVSVAKGSKRWADLKNKLMEEIPKLKQKG